MVGKEYEFWRDLEEDPFGDVFGESVAPIFDAGLADLVEPNFVVGDGVSFESTPGHTPGHVSVHIDSKDEKAIISGDMMHHPLPDCAARVGHPRLMPTMVQRWRPAKPSWNVMPTNPF